MVPASRRCTASSRGTTARRGDQGSAGVTFRNEDSADLAAALVRLLRDEPLRARVAARGRARAAAFDWSVVAEQIVAVYETVGEAADKARAAQANSVWGRLLRGAGRVP